MSLLMPLTMINLSTFILFVFCYDEFGPSFSRSLTCCSFLLTIFSVLWLHADIFYPRLCMFLFLFFLAYDECDDEYD